MFFFFVFWQDTHLRISAHRSSTNPLDYIYICFTWSPKPHAKYYLIYISHKHIYIYIFFNLSRCCHYFTWIVVLVNAQCCSSSLHAIISFSDLVYRSAALLAILDCKFTKTWILLIYKWTTGSRKWIKINKNTKTKTKRYLKVKRNAETELFVYTKIAARMCVWCNMERVLSQCNCNW